MWKELLLLVACYGGTVLSIRTECTHDSECGVGECCYYHEGPMVASKKRQVFNNFPVMFQGGWCERYLSLNERCDSIDKMNGHCGCGPGLTCTFISDLNPTVHYLTPSRKRDTIFGAHEESRKRGMMFGGHEECRPTN